MYRIYIPLWSLYFSGCLIGNAIGFEKIRVYEFGDDDPWAIMGNSSLATIDSASAPTYADEFLDGPDFSPPNPPFGLEFVDLLTANQNTYPTYVPGRTGGFALRFDGEDVFQAEPFDPRPNSKGAWTETDPNDFSLSTLSQAWVNPSSDGLGLTQVLWTVGPENGGVGITDDGFWEIVSPNQKLDGQNGSPEAPVTFDAWTHLAVQRTEDGAQFYVNGEIVGESVGPWDEVGLLTVGSNVGGERPFHGTMDEFNLSTYRGPGTQFDETADIDFFKGLVLSGVLGDVDQDSIVDIDDYQIWSANSGFDNDLGSGDPSTLLLGDVDQNGRINFFDFRIIAHEAAAAGNPLTIVPEPSSLVLLAIGFLAMLSRVRNT